jgi:hypothetical protein
MSARHTSGQWQSRDDYTTDGFVTIIGNIDGEILHDGPSYTYDVICVCEDEYGERLPNVAANVRLIASAPDLLEAVIQYRDDLKRPPTGDSLERRLAMVNAAIAKATGATS